MTVPPLPDAAALRAHPELVALAALAVALSLAREALAAGYPEEPDPLCPRLYAADLVLHHLVVLDEALVRYRAILAGEDALRLF